MRFKDLSISKKLTILLMGISTVAVLVACLTFYFLTVDRYKKSYLDDLKSLAAINGANCSASLAFNIPRDAEQLLSSLTNRPSIVAAFIYDTEDNVFTKYPQSIKNNKDQAGKNSLLDNISISHEIEMDGQKIGEIILYDDMRTIRTFKRVSLMVLSVIVFAVLGLTTLISLKLKGIISQPISNLVDTAEEISRTQDYSLHAKKDSSDEIGNLVDSFNKMITQISVRTSEISEKNIELQKRTEEITEKNIALHKSENRFRTFVNQAVDAFFLHDMDGRFVDVNQRACDSLGYSREELLTMTMSDIDPEAEKQQYKKKYWTQLVQERPETINTKHHRKDEESYPVEVRMGLLELGSEKLIMALARDTSERLEQEAERLQLENKLQQAQKMESIGTLAGGIAHDFNNILSAILGYTELAKYDLPPNSSLASNLDQVYTAGNRAKELVKQILTFSRQSEQELGPIQIHLIIKEALKLLRSSIPTTIEIRQEIDPHSGLVISDPTQIHQITMNLCTNAYHAMRVTGGVLGVTLRSIHVEEDDHKTESFDLTPGSYVELAISDTGTGMDKITMDKIFDPYFTTKEKGEGTGLGLSVVHGIIKSLGGHISVYSEIGQGTTFRLYLPKVTTDMTSEETEAAKKYPTGNERVLMVDDEEMLVDMGKKMLTSLGYDITAMTSSSAALQTFKKDPNGFDVIITDMTMPNMNGAELIQKIRRSRHNIPIILCTGFSELVDKERASSLGIQKYLMKPIVMREMAEAVREVLDKKLS